MLPASTASAGTFDGLSATLTLTSDYRFRGISQNDRSPAPQAEIDWKNDDGWSAGVWTSAVNFKDGENTSFEIDLFGGKEFNFGATDLAVTLYYYSYPDHHPVTGSVKYSTLEGVAVLSRSFGPVNASVTVAWSPDFFGGSGQAWSTTAGASYDLTEWLSASANVGRQWVRKWDETSGSGYPYTYWDMGFTATHGAFSLDLRYTGTGLSPVECENAQANRGWCEDGVIATVSYKTTFDDLFGDWR